MNRGRKLVTQLNTPLDYLTLAYAKQHLRVTSSADDTYITNLIKGAFDIASKYIGYNVCKSRVRYGFDSLVGQNAVVNVKQGLTIPAGNFLRIYSRVIAFEKLFYVDEFNALQQFASGDFITRPELFGDYGFSLFVTKTPTSLTDDQIKYIGEFTEGFETSNFPEALKIGILLLVQQYYDNRQSIVVGTIQSAMTYNHEYIFDPYTIPNFV
jgi:hypothetical protein